MGFSGGFFWESGILVQIKEEKNIVRNILVILLGADMFLKSWLTYTNDMSWYQ